MKEIKENKIKKKSKNRTSRRKVIIGKSLYPIANTMLKGIINIRCR